MGSTQGEGRVSQMIESGGWPESGGVVAQVASTARGSILELVAMRSFVAQVAPVVASDKRKATHRTLRPQEAYRGRGLGQLLVARDARHGTMATFQREGEI
jgi:hypothetical protein